MQLSLTSTHLTLQIVEVENGISLAKSLVDVVTQARETSAAIDFLVIEEGAYEQFSREEELSRRFLRQLSSKKSSSGLSEYLHSFLITPADLLSSTTSSPVPSPSSSTSKVALKLKFATSQAQPQQKLRHLQFIRIISLALCQYQLSAIVLWRRDKTTKG